MSVDLIHRAFADLIFKRGIYKKLGKTSNDIRQLRYKVQNNMPISTDLKLGLLQKSGWKQSQDLYDQKTIVKAVQFALKANASAKAQGAEYLVEKFLSQLHKK